MSLVKELRAASKLFKPEAHAAADYIEQLEKQRDQLLADLATAEQDSRQKQARIDRLERERDELLADVERCYKMLLSDPDTQGALFKAENILREAIAAVRGAV